MYVIIRGNSMQPTYRGGDLVIVHAQSFDSVGDIAAYRVPQGETGAGLVVIHRIVGGDAANGFVFKGDNNPAPDPWRPKQADMLGRAWYHLPGWGAPVVFIRQPVVIAALAAALVVAVILAQPPKRTTAQQVLLA
jgi:signal peptidase